MRCFLLSEIRQGTDSNFIKNWLLEHKKMTCLIVAPCLLSTNEKLTRVTIYSFRHLGPTVSIFIFPLP